MRGERLEVRQLIVFAHTNPHNRDTWYSGTRSAQIEPTSDTLALVGEATRLLAALWRLGFRYFKGGVMLNDLFRRGSKRECLPRAMSRNPRAPWRRWMRSMPASNPALCARRPRGWSGHGPDGGRGIRSVIPPARMRYWWEGVLR
jgi:hypothetical protein